MTNAIFCLEGEWNNNFSKLTTIEPVFTFLRSIEDYQIPYIHRNVATYEEFEHYCSKWCQKKYANYKVLYLAFHGDSGSLLIGDQRNSKGVVGFDQLEKLLLNKAQGQILYLGSCYTLEIHESRVQRFMKNTGLLAVCGYKNEIDFVLSSALDMIVLAEIGNLPAIDKKTLNTVKSMIDDKLNRLKYDTGKHCVFYHRYHIVWTTKYRYKVLRGAVQLRVRDIIKQVCSEKGVDIITGVLSSDHVHMFVSVPPKLAISDLVRLMKGRSSHKVQREFTHLKKRYWGCHFGNYKIGA